MDVLSPLLHLALRSLVVLFPLTVGWLAFRRLALSKSANAWIYAIVCLFSAVTSAGALPWALGLTPINWLLTVLALACPVIWVATILVCDVARAQRYGPDPLLMAARTVARKAGARMPPQDTPVPVFRHRSETVRKKAKAPERSTATKSLLRLARDIRGNPSSDRRRPKLVPPPEKSELSFLKRSRDA